MHMVMLLRNTHAYLLSHFEELRCDNLPSFTERLLKIFHHSSLKRAERLLKVGKLNTLSRILLWIKHGSALSLENVCDSCRLHQTRLFSSPAIVSQSKSIEFCNTAAVVPQSKSTEFCSSAAAVPQNNLQI